LRYSLKDDGDVKLEGSIETQILFHNLTTRLKYDELYVQVLHNGVSKYLDVKSDSECFVECSVDCRCMSFGVCENSCQLNAGSRKLVKNSLRHKAGCIVTMISPRLR
jgi:hypothetical protein